MILYYYLLFFIIYCLLFFIATSVRHRPSLPEMVFPHPLSLSANPEMTIDSGIGPGERVMHRILFLNLGRLAPKMVAGIFVRFSAHWWWVPFCLDLEPWAVGNTQSDQNNILSLAVSIINPFKNMTLNNWERTNKVKAATNAC